MLYRLIDLSNLVWILPIAAIVVALGFYIRGRKARDGKPPEAHDEKLRVAGEGQGVVKYERKDEWRTRLAVLAQPFKALVKLVGNGSDGEPASSRDDLARMIDALTERAREAIKDKEGLSSEAETLDLAAIDFTSKRFKEVIAAASDEQLNDLQHPLGVFAKSIEDRTREQYGVQNHSPEYVREVIEFGDWCAKAGHPLKRAKKYILIGEPAFKSYQEVNPENKAERPNTEVVCQFFTNLPAQLQDSAARTSELEHQLSEAEAALVAEKSQWAGFAEEKTRLLGQIETLEESVASKEADIVTKDASIEMLSREKDSLDQKKQQSDTNLERAQSTLDRLRGVGDLAEQLTRGRQSLDNLLKQNEYRVHLAFLMYYSLFNLCVSIVSKDEQKEKLMLVNLYQLTLKCKRYQDLPITPFEEVNDKISKGLESEHHVADVVQLKEELAHKAEYTGHSDHILFSFVLRNLRENCDIPLAPFFMDAAGGKLVGAN